MSVWSPLSHGGAIRHVSLFCDFKISNTIFLFCFFYVITCLAYLANWQKRVKKNIDPIMFNIRNAFWHSLKHILSSRSLPPGAQCGITHTECVRTVEVYWRCRSVRLESAMIGRGDKSGYSKSFLAGSRGKRGTKHRIRHSPVRSHFPAKCQTEQSLKMKADSVDVDVNFTYIYYIYIYFIYSFSQAFVTYPCNSLMPNPLLFGKHVIKQLIPLSTAHWLRARMIKLN